MTDPTAWLYIMGNRLNGTIYVGITSRLIASTNPNWDDLYEAILQ